MKCLAARWWWRAVILAAGVVLWLSAPADSVWADGGPPNPEQTIVQLDVQPLIVSPGAPLTYTLTLSNPAGIEQSLIVSATLPPGFELPLTGLPSGASYDLRLGSLQWSGVLAAKGEHTLVFSGLAPSGPLPNGWLTTYVAIDDGSQVAHLSASGWAGTAPTAAFSYTLGLTPDGWPQAGLVQFTDLSGGTGPLSAWWDLGDGTTSIELNPAHSYQAGGDYMVRLTVANPRGASSVTQTLSIGGSPDQSALSHEIPVSDDTPAVGQLVYFGDPSHTISATVVWGFGDGATAGEAAPAYVYEQPGVYTVTRVLGEGATAVQSSRVLRVGYPPQASIYVAAPAVSVGDLVTFTALTSAPEVTGYHWDFGDGNTASHGYVAHSYGMPGSYSVTLTVNNDFGVALDTLTLSVSSYVVYLPLAANNAVMPLVVEPAAELESDPSLPADPLAREMLQAINAEREAAGLPALAWSSQLARSSEHHTEDMAAHWFTGHIGSDGARPIDRMRQASYQGDYAGECTAWRFDNVEDAVAWWMTSAPHRIIVLSSVATEMGGAYTYDPNAPNVHYWAVDFGAQ